MTGQGARAEVASIVVSRGVHGLKPPFAHRLVRRSWVGDLLIPTFDFGNRARARDMPESGSKLWSHGLAECREFEWTALNEQTA